jgi:hypothetical protein
MRAVDAAICSEGGSINEPIAAGMVSGFPFSATSRRAVLTRRGVLRPRRLVM